MKLTTLKTQLGPKPPRYRRIKLIMPVLAFLLAYIIIPSEDKSQVAPAYIPPPPPKSQLSQLEPNPTPAPDPIGHFDMPLQTQTNRDLSIKWLIDVSKKDDNQLAAHLTKERQDLVEKISEKKKETNVDFDVLLRQNKIYQILDLDCLKHKKFTSPRSSGSGILGFIRSIFTKDPYDGVEYIFDNENSKYWWSSGNRLTVFSSTNVSPYYIKLLMLPQADNQRVSLFGLRIEEDKLAVVKTFSNYYLGSYDLSDCDRDGTGARFLTCVSGNCHGEYTFLMLIMEKIAIAELQVYGQRAN